MVVVSYALESRRCTHLMVKAFIKIAVFLGVLALANVIFWGGIIWMTLGALRFFGVL